MDSFFAAGDFELLEQHSIGAKVAKQVGSSPEPLPPDSPLVLSTTVQVWSAHCHSRGVEEKITLNPKR